MAFNVRKHLIKVQGGRLYLPVAARLVWFREEHPDWTVDTKPLHLDIEKGAAVFEATVYDETGRLMAKGTKMETVKGFNDYIEKAETGSIGRALAVCGFGTQFAPDLFEGNTVDAPIPPRESRNNGATAAQPKSNGNSKPLACGSCGTVLTQAQHDLSMQKFERALCPPCQKTVSHESRVEPSKQKAPLTRPNGAPIP